ncbi:MAG: hypothetical protein RQ753_06220 [Desulfurivibrionaceae bacterium]|nr:hypothetical protein [Desulfobulbales bacterium]MDT8335272.1 hypothetical protein [Desulfurivibrionaceae bacterium]
MNKKDSMQAPGDKVKKALKWISETVTKCPGKKRRDILKEAEIRFDLSPAECEFIDSNFA